jgi:hypothetical protein
MMTVNFIRPLLKAELIILELGKEKGSRWKLSYIISKNPKLCSNQVTSISLGTVKEEQM